MFKLIKRHRSLLSYFSFSMATSALGFVAVLVMMRLIPPQEYGRIALFMSIQFVAVPLISFAADSLIAINKSKLSNFDYMHFRCSYVTFAYLMFILIQTIFFFLYMFRILNDSLFLLIPIYGLVRFLISMASNEYVMEEKAIQYGLVAFSTALCSLLFTILFLSFFSNNAVWRIVSLLIADIVFLFVRYRGRMNLLWTFSFDKNAIKNLMRFGLPLLLSVAPAWALNESDKIIVARYADLASLGYYAAACSLGGIMITFNTAVLNALTPKIYSALGARPACVLSIVRRYVMGALGSASAFGGFFAIAYWLTADLILPEKYVAARNIVYVVILFALGRAVYSVLGLVTDYYGMTMAKLKGIIYGGATTVGVAVLGVVKFGVIGAAIGVGSGYLVLSSLLWLALNKKSRSL